MSTVSTQNKTRGSTQSKWRTSAGSDHDEWHIIGTLRQTKIFRTFLDVNQHLVANG